MRLRVHISTYTQFSLFEDLKTEWNPLLRRSYADSIFMTWEWCSTWWQAYQPGGLWVHAVQSERGELLAIIPLFIEQQRQERVARLIGCEDVTDYTDFIIDQDHVTPVFEALSDLLWKNQSLTFDRLELCNVPAHSLTYSHFAPFLKSKGFESAWVQNEVTPQIELNHDYEGYLEHNVDSKNRKEIKRKLRHAEGGEYDIRWYIVGAEHDLAQESLTFFDLMAKSNPSKAMFLSNPSHRQFFEKLISIMSEAGWLQLTFLQVDGVSCATYFSFDYNGRIWIYNSGLDPTKYSALSPGILLTQYLIQWAIEHHYTVFDFLRGNEEYKYRMGGKDKIIYKLRAHLNPTHETLEDVKL
jgi:CelD/BcsL family acetyltransferase involved in cellulose biosynthesis